MGVLMLQREIVSLNRRVAIQCIATLRRDSHSVLSMLCMS